MSDYPTHTDDPITWFAQEFAPLVDMASYCVVRDPVASVRGRNLGRWWAGKSSDEGIRERVDLLARFAVGIQTIEKSFGDNICWDSVILKYGAWDIEALPEILLSCFSESAPDWDFGLQMTRDMLTQGKEPTKVEPTMTHSQALLEAEIDEQDAQEYDPEDDGGAQDETVECEECGERTDEPCESETGFVCIQCFDETTKGNTDEDHN